MSLLQRWREVARDYVDAVPADEELHEFAATALSLIAMLAIGLGIGAIIGGFHA